jgi:ferredoxin
MAVRLLQIDPIACDAFGYCAELAPELVTLDEWGYPVVDPHPVPMELFDTAQAAIRSCPRRAIRLVKVRSASPERVALRSSNRHPPQNLRS